ncbi:hypothetical protein K1T71_000662 [Dendrolimus kikuchii]|uniref:Uncharacterized protein n=1 Tax=Dendrolimus kikuchii TaxID=765133 RepID=A0ACC1DKH1_9NEOP|nr:hypothetical protein K1T71_000662 [Dendrolimus kikuchii]
MALYTILFGISLFMIVMVMAVIKKMYFRWKREHKIERMVQSAVEKPAVCMMIYTDKCVMCRREYADKIYVYNVIDKSDISLNRTEYH